MKTLYLDLFSGISGDMFIGALLDVGLDFSQLAAGLQKLNLEGYRLQVSRGKRAQIEGAIFEVHLAHPAGGHAHGHGRNYADIRQLLLQSGLSTWARDKAVAVFSRIAAAEGKIHGVPAEQVHFHEVGAVDSIVDIAGACLGLELLGKPRVLAGQPIDGTGWIECAHGRFPVPAPATLEILAARGVALTQCEEPGELITPTGAALLAEFVEEFGPMKNFVPARIGFGLGSRDSATRPNVLRAILGETGAALEHDWETDTIAVLETNLDDVTPEILGHFMESALAAGALDVTYAPLQMKKNRPGFLLTVLCPAAQADLFSELILRQTSAFGVRRCLAERRKLRREFQMVETPFGSVSMKIGKLDGKVLQAAPEFESCRKLAGKEKLSLKQVYEAAMTAWNNAP
jgi:uncharacterized protein (TIGR00299 family) protein